MRLTDFQLRRLRRIVAARRPADAPPNPEALARWQLELASPATARWADRLEELEALGLPDAGPRRPAT